MAGRLAWNFNRMTTAAQAVSFFRGVGVTTGGLAITASAGRFGDAGLVFTNRTDYVSHPLSSETRVILGFALKGTGPALIWRAMDDATEQCSLWLLSDGRLQVRQGSTVLGTGTARISSTVHRWVEFNVIIDGAAGEVYLTVDGTEDMDEGTIDTTGTANDFATSWRFGEGNATTGAVSFTIADGYFCDATGGALDDILGMRRVRDTVASGTGTTGQFTANTGTTYGAIDDATPDGDTTYITSSTNGHKSTFAWGDLSGTISSIAFIQLTSYIQKTDAGARTVQHVARVSSSEAAGTAFTPSAGAYDHAHTIMAVQPDTTAWDQTDFNAAEFGPQIAS